MTDFAYWTDLETRFRDLDPLDHVNNAIYVTYLEEARLRYFRDVLDLELADLGTVLARVEVDFRRAITWDESVSVGVRVSEIGTKSFRMAYEIRADDEVAATAETVQVTIEPESDGTRPVPEEWRERIESYEPGL